MGYSIAACGPRTAKEEARDSPACRWTARRLCRELGVAEAATVGRRLAAGGIPTLHGHTATLRQLVLQAPPSAVAGRLGYCTIHAEAIAAEAGGTCKHLHPRRPHSIALTPSPASARQRPEAAATDSMTPCQVLR